MLNPLRVNRSTIFDKSKCYPETVEKDIILHFAHLFVVWLKRSRSSLRSFLCHVDVDWKTPVRVVESRVKQAVAWKQLHPGLRGPSRGLSPHLENHCAVLFPEQQCCTAPWTSKCFCLRGGKNWNSGFFFYFYLIVSQ